ncbi:MAG TPA: Ig-like domain-containing protein [Jatrophihabitantaceae bacterium]|nr:Ig-like domain-containing protein [Jatrophihabitantaceae bacterium]
MKLKLKTLIGGAAVAAVTGGVFLAGIQSAAAAAPSFEPDPGSVGSISFYDASGNQVVSGSVNDSPLAGYYAASGGGIAAGDNKAVIVYYTPQDGVPTGSWTTGETWTSTQTFGAAVSYPGSLAGSTNAIVKGNATDGPFSTHISAFPNASAANPGVYQIRLYTTQAGGGGNATYYSADISVSGTTWTQVFPAPPAATATTTSLTVGPASPQAHGTNVTLTASVAAASGPNPTNGSVQFFDGATQVGATQTYTGSPVSVSTTALTVGSHSLTAKYLPQGITFATSTSSVSTYVINGINTSTGLSITGGYTTAGSAATLTATVTPSSAPGAVTFEDNGTTVPGTVTNPTAGTYVLDLPSGFSAGAHSIVAKFAPSDPNYGASQSSAQPFITQAAQVGACAQPGSVCTDTQNITATVPVGTLVINTPYTAASPLDLGTLVLDPTTSATLSGSKPFQNIVVTDTRSGNLPWTVQAIATSLSDGGSNPNSVINAQNLGLTGLSQTSAGAGFTGALTFTDNAAANGVAPSDTGSLGLGGTTPHTVVATDHGLGTVNMAGTLTLIAPSSTEPGVFAGTITFTVG